MLLVGGGSYLKRKRCASTRTRVGGNAPER
jgi:hypothetical protein